MIENMENLINLKELLDNLCINFGGEELFISEKPYKSLGKEHKLINKVHNDLKDLREFMTDEEYQIVFDEEYKLAKAEETQKEIDEWFSNIKPIENLEIEYIKNNKGD